MLRLLRFKTAIVILVLGCNISAGQTSQAGSRKQLPSAEIVSEWTSLVDDLAAKDKFSGTILLARDNEVLLKKAFGLASRRFDVSNNVKTKFNLGSMNKMFTAVSVLQLVQQGKLSLDDRLSKYVDESWLPREITDKIQITHLLSHTSGLGSYFGDKFANTSREFVRELDDYKPMVADEKLAFEPGTRWQYSNTGMFILGVVIEKASGQSYFDFVREHVYKPAKMADSDCYDMDKPVKNLAIGYFKKDNERDWSNNLYRHVIRGGPAGGGFSTVDDLFNFSQALLKFELLDEEHTKMLVTPKPNSPGYGYGFEIEQTPAGVVVGHGGGFPGIHSKLEIYPDAGFTVIMLSNMDRTGSPVVNKIRRLITGNQGDGSDGADAADKKLTIALSQATRKSEQWHDIAYRLAFFLAYTGKHERYRELCNQTLADFSETTSLSLAERTVKMCLFSNVATTNLTSAGKIADRIYADVDKAGTFDWGGDVPFQPYLALAKGIAELRRGQYESAIKVLQTAKDFSQLDRHSACSRDSYLAIAHAKLGNKTKSAELLAKVEEIVDDFPPIHFERNPDWHDRVIVDMVRDEAQGLLKN
ncbi:serine hydrolase [Mariniblastus fucicola]|uniref:Penicillin-binding protein 4 n=1 Tax=Mariniblastus fucicola TaxID=980251 RepID=A0A5B9PCP1_9BACT|nr:serine hydrolase [Mariniblastus fucicola]QEG22925.1 Penicillin-binding protein 4* [Mariniblastus fucicola]